MTVNTIHSDLLAEPHRTAGAGATVSLKCSFRRPLWGGGVGEGLLVSIFIAEKEEHIGDDSKCNSNPKENS